MPGCCVSVRSTEIYSPKYSRTHVWGTNKHSEIFRAITTVYVRYALTYRNRARVRPSVRPSRTYVRPSVRSDGACMATDDRPARPERASGGRCGARGWTGRLGGCVNRLRTTENLIYHFTLSERVDFGPGICVYRCPSDFAILRAFVCPPIRAIDPSMSR